jgi:hypothetical protein
MISNDAKALFELLNEYARNAVRVLDLDTSLPDREEFFGECARIIASCGGYKVGAGYFSDVYGFEGVCVKVSIDNDFSKLPIDNPAFQRWFVPVFETSHFFCLCALVEDAQTYFDLYEGDQHEAYKHFEECLDAIKQECAEHNLELDDMHMGNLVNTPNGPVIIDYGCVDGMNNIRTW